MQEKMISIDGKVKKTDRSSLAFYNKQKELLNASALEIPIEQLVSTYGYDAVANVLSTFKKFPYRNSQWFDQDKYPSGKAFSEAYVKFMREEVFTDLTEHKGSTSYDDDLSKIRIEQKAIRALGPKALGSFSDRAQTKAEFRNTSRTWQQVKPDLFDMLLGAVVYLDRTDYYLIHRSDMCLTIHDDSPNKVKLGKQHAKGESWGQVNPFRPLTESFLFATSTETEPLENVKLLNFLNKINAGI
jgi:hypothetical protein